MITCKGCGIHFKGNNPPKYCDNCDSLLDTIKMDIDSFCEYAEKGIKFAEKSFSKPVKTNIKVSIKKKEKRRK